MLSKGLIPSTCHIPCIRSEDDSVKIQKSQTIITHYLKIHSSLLWQVWIIRVCLFVYYLMVCLLVCLFVWLMFVCWYVCLFVCLFVCLIVCLFVWLVVSLLFVCLFVFVFVIVCLMFVCLLLCLFVCMFVFLFVCLFVCLFKPSLVALGNAPSLYLFRYFRRFMIIMPVRGGVEVQ